MTAAITTSTTTTTTTPTNPFPNVQPEFVAVVLAASVGARLFPMSSVGQPKHLLPAAGLPLLERLLTGGLRDFAQVFVAIAADDQTTVPTLFEHSSFWESADAAMDPTATTTTTSPPTTTTTTTTPFPKAHSVWKPKDSNAAAAFLSTNHQHQQQLVTVVRMPEDCPGSAEVLRQLEGLLPRQAHTVVVPGDLLVTQANTTLAALVQAHRQGQKTNTAAAATNEMAAAATAACTVLLHDVGEQDEHGVPLKESAKQKKGGLARDAEDIEYMALAVTGKHKNSTTTARTTPRLVWKQGKLAAEQDEGFTLTGQTPKLQLPKARLRPHGVVKVRNDWNDLHVYVLSPWVVRLVQAKTSIVSLQADLLPLLIRRQFLGKVETFGQGVEPHIVLEILEDEAAIVPQATTFTGLLQANNALSPKDANTATSMTTAMLMKPNQTYSVLAHVVTTGAMRCSSLPAYLHASKDLLTKLVDATQQRKEPFCLRLPAQATTNPKFGSLLLSNQIGDKPTLKACAVGQGCRLGNKCRLNNVILMDDVQLGDNVVLQNTIVGKEAVIGDNCSLNDCQVAAGMQVESGTKEKGEVLVDTMTVG